MVKHICICDRCGFETDMLYVGDDKICSPSNWERFGVCPKYLLCPSCKVTLEEKQRDLIYLFVSNKDKRVLIQVAEK